MKIKLANLGVLRQAEFNLGDLTIICGDNNTGKTYATHALFGFLWIWENMLQFDIRTKYIETLRNDGIVRIDVSQYVEQADEIIADASKRYTEQLPRILAAATDKFKDTHFEISLQDDKLSTTAAIDRKVKSEKTDLLSFAKKEGSKEMEVSLLASGKKLKIPSALIKESIADAIKEIIFEPVFPRPFIASTERTGSGYFPQGARFCTQSLAGRDESIGQEQ